ncbi:GNAT family N-acetyltransferase [Thermoleophilia bacterium SCSIO 60948]|nr:GNAT family N-acetyltransferase [Thermoleophilia bacterium SCSIO 60948]
MPYEFDLRPLRGGERSEWLELARATGGTPFVRPGWIEAWAESFAPSQPLQLAWLRRDGELRAVAPVLSARGAIRSAANWHSPLYSPVFASLDDLGTLSGRLAKSARRYIDLGWVPTDDAIAETVAAAAELASMRVLRRTVMRSPYIATEGRDSAEFEAGLPSRRLSKYRRFARRLGEQGEVRMGVEDPDGRLGELLEEGFAIEGSGWKSERGTAIADSESTLAFYRRIAEWASEEGTLRLWFLRLDGRAIAFAFCLDDGVALYDLKVGYDTAFSRYAPATLLMQARIRHAFDSGLEGFEFLGSEARHKLDWTDTCHERDRIQAFRPLGGALDRLAWERGRPAAAAVRERLRERSNEGGDPGSDAGGGES